MVTLSSDYSPCQKEVSVSRTHSHIACFHRPQSTFSSTVMDMTWPLYRKENTSNNGCRFLPQCCLSEPLPDLSLPHPQMRSGSFSRGMGSSEELQESLWGERWGDSRVLSYLLHAWEFQIQVPSQTKKRNLKTIASVDYLYTYGFSGP